MEIFMLHSWFRQISGYKVFYRNPLPFYRLGTWQQRGVEPQAIDETDDSIRKFGDVCIAANFSVFTQRRQMNPSIFVNVRISNFVQSIHAFMVNGGSNKIYPCSPIVQSYGIRRKQRKQISTAGFVGRWIFSRTRCDSSNSLLKRKSQKRFFILKIMKQYASGAAHFPSNISHRCTLQSIANNDTPCRIGNLDTPVLFWQVRLPSAISKFRFIHSHTY